MPVPVPFVPGAPRVYTVPEIDNMLRAAVAGAVAVSTSPVTVDIGTGDWSDDSGAPPVREGDTWKKASIAHGLGSLDASIISAVDAAGYAWTWLTWKVVDADTIDVWADDTPSGTITFKVTP